LFLYEYKYNIFNTMTDNQPIIQIKSTQNQHNYDT